MKKNIRILMGIASNLFYNAFYSISIFTVLIPLIYEHGKSFHCLVSSFFLQCFKIFILDAFHYFGYMFSKTVCLFDFYFCLGNCEWDVSPISLLICLLLLYRKATDFFKKNGILK